MRLPNVINHRAGLIIILVFFTVVLILFAYWNNKSIPINPIYKPTIVGTYPITIDYNKSLDEMIAKYNKSWWLWYVDVDVTPKNFPVSGSGIVNTDIILVQFDHGINKDNVKKELVAMELEPARIEHAAMFGEKYPEVYRKYPIVFLGSTWAPSWGEYVPELVTMYFNQHRLDLNFDENHSELNWSAKVRFAAIRKVSNTP